MMCGGIGDGGLKIESRVGLPTRELTIDRGTLERVTDDELDYRGDSVSTLLLSNDVRALKDVVSVYQ